MDTWRNDSVQDKMDKPHRFKRLIEQAKAYNAPGKAHVKGDALLGQPHTPPRRRRVVDPASSPVRAEGL